MERLKRSWRLFTGSFSILLSNKKLLLFPMLAAIGILVIALFFLIPIIGAVLAGGGQHVSANTEGKGVWAIAAGAFLVIAYLVSMFLTTFFNVAFYGEIMRALNGEEVSIKRGFRLALSKFVPILMWSLFAGVIGYLIKSIEEKFGFLGKIIIDIIGLAWSIAAVFAIPVIVTEEGSINPVGYLKKSASVIRKTWGESLAGYVGFSTLTSIGVILSLVVLIAGIALAALSGLISSSPVSIGLLLCVAALWLLTLVAFIIACDVAEKIYLCSLYKYATEGIAPEHLRQEDLDSAWKPSK